MLVNEFLSPENYIIFKYFPLISLHWCVYGASCEFLRHVQRTGFVLRKSYSGGELFEWRMQKLAWYFVFSVDGYFHDFTYRDVI